MKVECRDRQVNNKGQVACGFLFRAILIRAIIDLPVSFLVLMLLCLLALQIHRAPPLSAVLRVETIPQSICYADENSSLAKLLTITPSTPNR